MKYYTATLILLVSSLLSVHPVLADSGNEPQGDTYSTGSSNSISNVNIKGRAIDLADSARVGMKMMFRDAINVVESTELGDSTIVGLKSMQRDVKNGNTGQVIGEIAIAAAGYTALLAGGVYVAAGATSSFTGAAAMTNTAITTNTAAQGAALAATTAKAVSNVIRGVPRAKPLVDKVPATNNVVKLIDPNKIRFSQDSIRGAFSNGKSVADLVKGLKNGSIKPNDIPPIRVIERNGQLVSIDNRRLAAFREAGIAIRTRLATTSEIAQAQKFGKFSAGPSGSQTIRIR